ncbi:hypothetical protein QEG73_01135 [Chitinophagaceae bacterium 26-R-25]|nr:hypothetical protein [Chitinophagaceae bacterium 26-R-25]
MRNIKSEIIGSLLILLFAYTAFQKYMEHDTFLWTLERSTLLHSLATPLSWMVPATELAVVCLLIFPSLRRIGLLCSVVLLTTFTLYIIYMLLFTPNLPCSCGGIVSYLSWKQHLVFNTIFLLLALYGWYSMRNTHTTDKNIAIRRSRTPVI